jgi:hypothetical protein
VGALAGIGLRLSGNNGRFRGSVDLTQLIVNESDTAANPRILQTGKDINSDKSDQSGKSDQDQGQSKDQGKGNRDKVQQSDKISNVGIVTETLGQYLGGKVRVVNNQYQDLHPSTKFRLSRNVKAIWQKHAYTIITTMQNDIANAFGKTDLDELFPDEAANIQVCRDFQPDTDSEEQIGIAQRTCVSCLYRRWESHGFSCVAKKPELITEKS